MKEKSLKRVKQTVEFEKSGEIISVEIVLENIYPQTNKKAVYEYLDKLFKDAKTNIFSDQNLEAHKVNSSIRGITVNLP